MKLCSKCRIGKLKTKFHKVKTKNDGINPNFKVCVISFYKENLLKIKKILFRKS